VNRRDLLKLTALSALPGSLLSARAAMAQADTIQFGCPVPISGAFAANGKFADIGMKLALEEYGKVLGKPLSYTALDTEGKPATAVRKVQEAARQRGTKFFAGGILSSESLAMGKEIERLGGVFITTAGADEITGTDCNRATFRWSVPTFGAINQTVRPLIDLHPNAKRWYTITPQYVFGDGLLNAAKAIFREKGLEHVGNSYHSLTEKDSRPSDQRHGGQARRVLLLNFGSQNSDTLRQAVSFGMKKNMVFLVAWASGLEQFESLGADTCEGVYFGAQYWHGIDSSANAALVKLCGDKLGYNPNYSLAGSYTCTRIMLDAIAKANSADPRAGHQGHGRHAVRGPDRVRDHPRRGPPGAQELLPAQGQGQVRHEGQGRYADIISSGQSFLSPEQAGCKL